jgi:Undecaprenyl-phosphate galactose phosphotransferase WbaP
MNLASSRIVFLFTYLFAALFLPLMRHWIRNLLVEKDRWGVPVSIYGGADKIESTLGVLQSDLKLGYQPTAIYSDDLSVGSFIKGVPVLGDMQALNSTTPIGVIIQGSVDDDQFNTFIQGPAENYRRVIILPELLAAPSLWVSPIDFEGVLGLEVTKNLLNPLTRIGKMSADYAAVLLTFPIWILIVGLLYVLIWIEDRKNPLFLQKRIGKNGKSFDTIKFRTMVPNAEERLKESLQADPALRAEWEKHFKLKKDPRITKIGMILRRTSLDELPQLFNVLNGSMSLVGPRPLPSYHFEDLPESVQQLRHQVKPGITGLWQVSGRSEAGTAGMEKWDPYYVRNWSIWLDIIILVRTIRTVLFARGAY